MKAASNSKWQTFYINADAVAYEVQVAVSLVNDQQRFNVKINNGEEHIYTWDEQIQSLRPLNDSAATIPENLEKALSDQLIKTVVIH